MALSPRIAQHLLRTVAKLAFRRVEVTGLQHLSDSTIDIIVGDTAGRWTGPLLLAAALPVPCVGILDHLDAGTTTLARALGWIELTPKTSKNSGNEALDEALHIIRDTLVYRSKFVMVGGAFSDPIFASVLALSLATEFPDRTVRLIPAGVRRVSAHVGRESALVQLASPITVSALRIGQRWQKRQCAAELTRLVEESQAIMRVETDDWSALRAWDAICRLHRAQQLSGWSHGTSQRMFTLLQDEPDGQRLAARVQAWLDALESTGLRPSDLERSLDGIPSSQVHSALKLFLLPLVLVGIPLFAGVGWIGRTSTAQMFKDNDWPAWLILLLSNTFVALLFTAFCFALLAVKGAGYGALVSIFLITTGWVTYQTASQSLRPACIWNRLKNLGRRSRIYAWAWQERASLLESIRAVLTRPRGDDPPLFPRSLLER